ncbi:NYN domain-containing protein [Pseudomonas chlororaphis]|uniref:NYN domain n=1 Tax=Pseudomonas chlororaphis TaxID=587753 RepID=A0AAX3FU06_9PSED|nr:NYN domain-containing protein [Pseudomonas chlororaphis]AZC39737.1 Maebl [Pseudomonas chlororaphis subsp. piscium]AZC46289.1 Maebl [Pseudomonas chlororaphis subsp. piscium]WDG71807.1 NYN domain-containing protein [Pseudomonas chlororaphis]WDH30410.1 NYN domain-containing protein [Pseudomonas chlororaphis]WDH70332.1 NYN domain-containing protein [Pseudomonas chlororaphis]
MATKSTHSNQQKHLAVLIDADNAQASIVEALFEEIAKYGIASVKRMYGDWTGPQLGGWKKLMLEHSIQPIQQFAYTKGKNSTDSSLIIDAMDLLYTRRFDGFCLVSSDSDFTRLAGRLREEGLMVYGFGEAKTPEPFVKACDKFIYTEILRPQDATESAAQGDKAQATSSPIEEAGKQPAASSSSSSAKVPVEFIAKILDDIAEEDGWAPLAMLGTTISKVRPAFDSRLYGHTKLSGLIRSQSKWFDLDTRGGSPTGGAVLYVRNKNRAPDQQAR